MPAKERFGRFELDLRPDKPGSLSSRGLPGRIGNEGGQRLTFDFLGFTHYCEDQTGALSVGTQADREDG